MRPVIYSMNVSLDGFIAGPDGTFEWSEPDEELHRFFNDMTRETGVNVYGRRLYETMRYWETAEQANPSAPEWTLEFARFWNRTPRLVFSRTLERAEGGAELARGSVGDEIARLKEQPGGIIAVGGAGLAAELVRLDLIDEYWPVVHPVVVGGGTPFLPALDAPLKLRLAETRTFGSGVVHLRYLRR